jgi:hypothetical protein
MEKARPLRTDPYNLANRYREYIRKHPLHKRDDRNTYYDKLLANCLDPRPDATDDKSRAIRYAKEHYECFYEIRDISRIVEWLKNEPFHDARNTPSTH